MPLYRRWKEVIDATDLIGAGRTFQIFGADALKAWPTVVVLADGTTSVSEAEKRSSRFGMYF